MDGLLTCFYFVLGSYQKRELVMTYLAVRIYDLTLLGKMVPFYFKVSHLKSHVYNQPTSK